MKKTTIALLLSITACGAAEQPEESPGELDQSGAKSDGMSWCHANLDTGDTEMVFDYQVASVDASYYAKNTWLNVSNSGFSASDSAQAVVVVSAYDGNCGTPCSASPQYVKTLSYPMHYENGRFTTQVTDLDIHYAAPPDGSSVTAYVWELAVNVNGTWYKDANTGNNLRYLPSAEPRYCAQGHSL